MINDAVIYNTLIAEATGRDTRPAKVEALAKLGITVADGQTPLRAWITAMAERNGLEVKFPQTEVGEAAAELCPKWVFWLTD